MNHVSITTASRGPIPLASSRQTLGYSEPREESPGMRVGAFIDLHKALVIPVVLALMGYYHNGSTDAFVYLGMHGSYSLLWLIKQRTYRDMRFDERVHPLIGLLFIFLPLAGYYVAPYMLISRHISVPPAVVGLAVIDFPSAWASTPEEYLSKGQEVRQQWGDHPRLTFAVAPHAPYTVSDAYLSSSKKLAAAAATGGHRIHTHLHETKAEVESERKNPKKAGVSFKIPRQGAGQVILIGGPNAGKSRILSQLTRATPEVAPYPFTTREPSAGMMDWEDVRIQLIDTPPITPDYLEGYVSSMVRASDGCGATAGPLWCLRRILPTGNCRR